MRLIILLLVVFSFCFPGIAQNKAAPSPIIFIYDASGSMWGQMQGKTKMEIASRVLSSSVEELPDDQNVGLVAYGHRSKGDCKDVEFIVEMESGNKSKVNSALQAIKPLGKTPLAYSANLVINKMKSSNIKATIILLTDGIESCDGNICEVIKTAKEEGIDFRLHIIGFGLKDSETEQLRCAATAGDGRYYDAANANDLSTVLNEATSETIDKPKGNVSVFAIKNGAAIDAWVRAYDVVAKREPISVRTYGDTASFYLPTSTYNLEVKPLAGSDVKMQTIKGVQSFDDKVIHQNISFDAGKIGIITTNNGTNWDCVVKVVDTDGKEVAALRTYQDSKEVELDPGVYKIRIQALGEMKGLSTNSEIENIEVKAGETTPVSYAFETGTAFIESKADGNFIDSVVTITESSSNKNIASGRTYDRGKEFLLNPGNYNVKVAPLGNYKDRKAQTFRIEIKKGENTAKSVNF